jgi:uncharacterized protein
MKRLVAALLALLGSSTVAFAQSSVWKVSRGSSTLYLGGTCHVLRSSDFPLPLEFDAAYAASTEIYFETDISRMQSAEMQNVLLNHGMFTDGMTLDKVLTPHAWKAAQAYCAKAGIPIEMVNGIKPWMFVLMMSAIELKKIGIAAEGVDLHYFRKASAAGRKIGSLETLERQLEFLVNLGAGHESEMISSSLKELDAIPKIMNALLTAWRRGDVAAIDKLLLNDVRTKHPAIFRELFVSRNNAWLPKIEEMLTTPEVEFVLVGAGHLSGKEGLLALLRARGYRLEQIKATVAARSS